MKYETDGKRLLIGVDMDDVLFDCCNTLNAFHNETFGSDYARIDYTVYDLAEVWQCSHDDIKSKVEQYYMTDHHTKAEPVAGAAEAIAALRHVHDFCVVTARAESSRSATETWIEKHFPGVFSSIHFTSHFFGSTPARTKREVCEELGVDVFIDDALHNAIDIAAPHRPVLLLDNPWNQAETPEHVRRVHSWDEILDILK